MGRWVGVVILAVVGSIIVGDWVWWGIEVAQNPPSSLYAAEFLFRCAVSIGFVALLYRLGTRR